MFWLGLHSWHEFALSWVAFLWRVRLWVLLLSLGELEKYRVLFDKVAERAPWFNPSGGLCWVTLAFPCDLISKCVLSRVDCVDTAVPMQILGWRCLLLGT